MNRHNTFFHVNIVFKHIFIVLYTYRHLCVKIFKYLFSENNVNEELSYK